ncbi:glycosyltransferase family 2 protein [Paenibacillus sanguinis]|uniref:glycosyltransferase family 2 protein n=1 Tax=Paenibacillus sanguinis TaxID=225906 RepID=UPI000368EEB5|nr:glycosyltransferase family 2 protein [Paenibacillus sanguinis]
MSSKSNYVSIIIAVKNHGIDLYTTMESMKVSQTVLPYEVIIVDEGSVDGCCDFLMNYRFDHPVKRIKGEPGISARHLGVAHASGKYLIFCGSHLYYEDHWMERLLAPLISGQADSVSPVFVRSEHSQYIEPQEIGGVLGGIRRYPAPQGERGEIPWLSWECFAISRDKYQELGGLEDGFFGKEMETAEFSLRTWLLGGRCQLVPEVTLMQVLRKNFPYDDSREKWGQDLLTLAYLHFGASLITACESLVQEAPSGWASELQELRERTKSQRENYFDKRIHDDVWFYKRFAIEA